MTLSRLPLWALNRLHSRLTLAMQDAAYLAQTASRVHGVDYSHRARRYQRMLARVTAALEGK